MRRLAVTLVAALVVVLAGHGLAGAAFTAHRTTPQSFTAVDSFEPPVALSLQSRSNDGGASGSQVQLGLRLTNTGEQRVDLDTVAIRYWFTTDGSTAEPVPACYYATFGCRSLGLDVLRLDQLRVDADHYLQVTFRGGRLGPGDSAQLDQLAFRDPGGATYRQDNDHSFLGRSVFTDNARVTVYVDGALVWGTEPRAVPPRESVQVQYANRDAAPTDPAISFQVDVLDTGTTNIDLSRLTLRYWFTRDGGTAPLLGFCDYAQLGCGTVATSFGPVTPARPGADSYLEVGFTGGTLGLGSSTGPIQLRAHQADYAPFDERDDHSWDTSSVWIPNPRITAYLDGVLVWGTEP